MATYIIDKGNDFDVQQLNRAVGARPVTKFKVDGDTGAVTVAGTTTVSGKATFSGDATFSGTVALTGTTTGASGNAVMTGNDFIVCQAGKDGAGALTLTGARVGDSVVGVFNLTTPGDLKSSFETTITVINQIQQSSQSNLSGQQIVFILHHP